MTSGRSARSRTDPWPMSSSDCCSRSPPPSRSSWSTESSSPPNSPSCACAGRDWTELVGEGRHAAKDAILVVDRVTEYLAVTQIGITAASLGVGWFGEDSFAGLFILLLPTGYIPTAMIHVAAAILAFLLITTLHVVRGRAGAETSRHPAGRASRCSSSRARSRCYTSSYGPSTGSSRRFPPGSCAASATGKSPGRRSRKRS